MAGIKPGLERITSLIRIASPHGYPWKSIHVAGTNGKGSVCAYISAMLHHLGIPCGTFTSPHLIHRHDCIKINTRPVTRSLFEHHHSQIQQWNDQHKIGATSFELLTVTAFEIFKVKAVKVAVIEAGMGGKLDATNVIDTPECAVITKIGLDHQEFLGNTIEDIAGHKAGIIKPGGKYVVDKSNDAAALDVISTRGQEVGAPSFGEELSPVSADTASLMNQSLARRAIEAAIPELQSKASDSPLARAVQEIQHLEIPGRQQLINIEPLTGRKEQVLLDGAHNPQSAKALRMFIEHMDQTHKTDGIPKTWLFAASRTKDASTMFAELVRKNDIVVTTQFGPVDGMPWVSPKSSSELASIISNKIPCKVIDGGSSVLESIKIASEKANGRPLIIAGSLYLAGDVLRLLEGQSY